MILYSIVIAVYNVEKYLEECLESILAQDYNNWECILVDDGSTDEKSGRICDIYAKKDNRFKVFHRKNEGSLMARRFGFRQSVGDYVLFADSDDYVHRDLLKVVNKIIEQSQSDLVIYRFQWVSRSAAVDSEIIFPEGTILGRDEYSRQRLWKRVLTCNSLNNLCLKVARRNCVDIEEDYSKFANLKSGTDLMQSMPILDNANKIYFTENIFYFYRYNNSGISSQKAKRTSVNDINEYFRNRSLIMDRRVEYLIKNNAASAENMSLHYAACFKNSMEILVSWLVNEPDKKKRKCIIRQIIQEKSLEKCRKYIRMNDLTGYNRYLYRLYVEQEFNKFSILLNILRLYKKAIVIKGSIMDHLMDKRSRNRNMERSKNV